MKNSRRWDTAQALTFVDVHVLSNETLYRILESGVFPVRSALM